MIQLEYPPYLLLLLGLPVMIAAYYFVVDWKKKAAASIGDQVLVATLIRNYSPSRFLLKFILAAVAYALGVFALANPRVPNGGTKENYNGIDVVIALDVSNSMLAEDIKPNRLERAKEFISKLIDRLANDRIGLVVFAGRAYLQMPLTIDHDAAKMYLSTTSTEMVPVQGTVIGDALRMSYAAFNPQEKKYRSIVLVTDGEDHDKEAVKIARQLGTEGIMLNTVGFGSPEGSLIPDPQTHDLKKDENGNVVISKLNEDELREIAAAGNGLYQLYTSTDEISRRLQKQLDTIGQQAFTANASTNYRTYFQWLLAVVLMLLIGDFILPEKKKWNPLSTPKASGVLLSFLLIFISFSSFAQKENKLIRSGNKAYKKKELDKAIQNYQQATSENPSSYDAYFNLGNALFKSGKTTEAIEAYDQALQHADSTTDKEAAWYNKGVVLQHSKKLPDCIDAYKNALKLNPADQDARLNLQKALQQQKQEQQQQQQKNQPDKNKQQPPKQKQQEQQKEQQSPPPMSKEDAEEKLKALAQQEQNLQEKLRKAKAASTDKPEKDW